MAGGAPLASKTMSAPHPSVSSSITPRKFSFATLTGRIGPKAAARSSFGCWTSVRTTWLHPPAIAASAVTIPIGSRSHDDREVTRFNFRFHGCMHAYRQRFNHRALGEADVLWKLERVGGRMNHIGRQDIRGLAALPRSAPRDPNCIFPTGWRDYSGQEFQVPCRRGHQV